MKLLIVAAKTGGHIYPAVSVAKELIKNNHKLYQTTNTLFAIN